MFDYRGLKVFLQQWHELVTNPGPHSFGVEIGCVLSPALTVRLQILAQIFAAHMEQRAKHRSRLRMNSAKSGKPSAAKDVRHDGFRLIIRGVRHRNFRDTLLAYQ